MPEDRCIEKVEFNGHPYRCNKPVGHPGYHRTTYGGRWAKWLTAPADQPNRSE